MEDKKRLGVSFKIIANTIKRTIHQSLDYNLTDNQMFILIYVAKNQSKKDILQKDIEKILNIRRSTTTEILQIMERENLIKRIAVLDDKRLKKIILSDKGLNYVKQFEKKIKQVEKCLLNDISEEEQEQFFKILEKIKTNLNNIKYWDEEEIC